MNFGKPVLDVANGKGRITMYVPKPGVVFFQGEGFLTADLWAPQVPVFEKAFGEGPKVSLFRDASKVRTLETAYREASQVFMKAHAPQYEQIVFLATSAVVRLAVTASALFSKAPIVAVSEAEFNARLAKALEDEQNLPTAQSA